MANSDNLVESSFYNLETLLSGNYIFRVPSYQRGYAWEKSHVLAFYNDVIRLYKNTNTRENNHYISLIVLDPLDSKEKGKEHISENTQVYYIVDGQQRLTTLIIFLAATLKVIRQKDPQNSLSTFKEDITYKDGILETLRFDYSISQRDNRESSFKKRVVDDTPLDLDDIYKVNIDNAYNSLTSLLWQYDADSLIKIKDILLNNVVFNVCGINSSFDVRTAFEAMNNRGKKLSTLEILKDRLMYLATLFRKDNETESNAEKELIGLIDTSWNEIYNNLSKPKDKNGKNYSLNDDDFLVSHWFIYNPDFVKGIDKQKRERYWNQILNEYFDIDTMLKQINGKDTEKAAFDKIKNYVNSLSKCSKIWAYLHDQSCVSLNLSSECRKETELLIFKLTHIFNKGGRDFIYSLLMATLYKEPENPKLRKEFYEYLEKLIFLTSSLLNYKGNDYSFLVKYVIPIINSQSNLVSDSVYEKLINEILTENSLSFKTFLSNDKREQTQSEIKEKFFSHYLNDGGGFYDGWGKDKVKYLLFNVDLTRGSYQEDDIKKLCSEYDKISIEHVYPQSSEFDIKEGQGARNVTAKKYWEKAFKDLYKEDDKDKRLERRGECVNMMGNLLLLSSTSENSKLQNRSFPVKKGYPYLLSKNNSSLNAYLKSFSYDQSRFTTTKSVAMVYEQWTPLSIRNRTIEIFDAIYSIWFAPFNKDERFISDNLYLFSTPKNPKKKENIPEEWKSLYSDTLNSVIPSSFIEPSYVDLEKLAKRDADDVYQHTNTILKDTPYGEKKYNAESHFYPFYAGTGIDIAYQYGKSEPKDLTKLKFLKTQFLIYTKLDKNNKPLSFKLYQKSDDGIIELISSSIDKGSGEASYKIELIDQKYNSIDSDTFTRRVINCFISFLQISKFN